MVKLKPSVYLYMDIKYEKIGMAEKTHIQSSDVDLALTPLTGKLLQWTCQLLATASAVYNMQTDFLICEVQPHVL
jgi:hypothetical protein